MAQASHKLQLDKTRMSAPSVRSDELSKASSSSDKRNVRSNERVVQKYERAKDFLRIPTIPAKTFAFELECSERFVQQMAASDRKVPEWMIEKILNIGTKILWEQKRCIDSYIERALTDAYGKGAVDE